MDISTRSCAAPARAAGVARLSKNMYTTKKNRRHTIPWVSLEWQPAEGLLNIHATFLADERVSTFFSGLHSFVCCKNAFVGKNVPVVKIPA
jgi:hypothetical protein